MKRSKKLLIFAAALAASLAYYVYIWHTPNQAMDFFQTAGLASCPTEAAYTSPETGELVYKVLSASQREAAAAVLAEMEVRRYALWEPWDTSTWVGNSLQLIFYIGDERTETRFSPNGRFLCFRDQKYFFPKSALFHEKLLTIFESEE